MLSRIGAGETLIRINENAELEPALAESWEQTDDNTWVFHIRKDVRFSNGTPVDAEACKNAIQRAYDTNSRAPEYFALESMTADGQDLTIVTSKPCGALTSNLCEPLFTIIDTTQPAETLATAPVCTGPYVITAFTPEASVELSKNADYWDGEGGLDTISVVQVADSDSRVLAMQSGEADLTTTIDNSNLALFTDTSKYTISEVLGPRCNVIYMNNKTGFCSDIVIRKALSTAIDRQTYAGLISGETATGLYSSALACGTGVTGYTYDTAAANKLLDDAGYLDTNGDGIREKGGQPITLKYYLAADHGSSDSGIIAQSVQADAAKVGIRIELVQAENLSDIKKSGSFDLVSANDSTAPTADPEVFLVNHYLTGAAGNYGGYSNAKVDESVAALATIFEPGARQDAARAINQLIVDDAANLYISYIKGNTVSAAKVENAVQFPIDYYIITKDITIK